MTFAIVGPDGTRWEASPCEECGVLLNARVGAPAERRRCVRCAPRVNDAAAHNAREDARALARQARR